jgi:hypothetical protein
MGQDLGFWLPEITELLDLRARSPVLEAMETEEQEV